MSRLAGEHSKDPKTVQVSATKDPPVGHEHKDSRSSSGNDPQASKRTRRPSLTVPAPIGRSEEQLVTQTLERAGHTRNERQAVVELLREAQPGSRRELSWPSDRANDRQGRMEAQEKAVSPTVSATPVAPSMSASRRLPARSKDTKSEMEQVYARITQLVRRKGFSEIRRRCVAAAIQNQTESHRSAQAGPRKEITVQSQRLAELRILQTQFSVDLSHVDEEKMERLISAPFERRVEFVLRMAYSDDPEKCLRRLDAMEAICKSSAVDDTSEGED